MFFFFFQAEDGIRDDLVTGVQTCALPISAGAETERVRVFRIGAGLVVLTLAAGLVAGATGYMRLARLLASSVFSGGVLALTLYACTRVATGVVALTLRVWPLNLPQMVQHHRDQ